MPRSPLNAVLVVGAGAAGISAAEGLRRHGFGGTITIVGEESEPPYDRPPLSKQILSGSWSAERIRLLSEKRREALAADWRLGRRAAALDAERRSVLLDDGSTLHYGALIIASGVRPRTLPDSDMQGVHLLRTRSDADALRRTLGAGRRLVVVGAGFLGLEVAATARALGVDVTVVEQQSEPLRGELGARTASRLVALHRANGVHLLTGLTVARFRGSQSGNAIASADIALESVELSDGKILAADAALVAIGCVPCVDWLVDTPLRTQNGVRCDEHCRAAPAIWAAGDVAQWHHAWLARDVRLEHRMNATQQGAAVAADIMGASEPFVPAPYFWTDQYDVRIQACGFIEPDEAIEVAEVEADDGESFVAEYRRREDRSLVGALAWNSGRHVASYRREIEEVICAQ